MLQKNPEYTKEIIDFVDDYFVRCHRSPSCREIAAGTTLKHSSVHNYLVAMEKNGMIEYNGQIILTPKSRELFYGTRKVGIVGPVSGGLPADPDITLSDFMILPLTMVGQDEVYILYAEDKSMTGAGIDAGDILLVRKQDTAKPGDIVLVRVENEGNIIRRLRREGGQTILHPENPEMPDTHVDSLAIQGVVIWIMKHFEQND